MKKTIGFLIGIGLISCLNADIGKLSKIVDGDTVKFNDTTCRFAYIDTPESKRNDRAKNKVDECPGLTLETMVDAGKESVNYLNSILEIGKSYKYDVISTDRYDRKVCVIWLNNNVMLNENLVREGYAVPYYTYIKDSDIERQMRLSSMIAKKYRSGLFKSHESVMQCLAKSNG